MKTLRFYGSDWRVSNPVAVELALYAWPDEKRRVIPGALSRAEHLSKAIRLLLPEGSGLEWHFWLDDLIEAWCERDVLSVWGPSSAGKSSMIGLLAYVDLLAAPPDTYTLFITDSLGGHKQRSWSQMLAWRSQMPKEWQVGKLADSSNLRQLVTTSGGSVAGIYCSSTAPGDSVQDLKRKLGGHNRRNRLLVDEAQTCSDSVLALKMNLGASGEYKEILFGNPDAWSNPLGVHSQPADDDREKCLRQEVTKWETSVEWHGQRGLCLVFDGRNSPGCAHEREAERLHFLPSKVKLANYAAQEGGEDSPTFWTYAVGRIPPGGRKPVVLSEADWRESGCWNKRPWASGVRREKWVGIDLSLGGDAVPVYLVETGQAQSGLAEKVGDGGPVIAQVTAAARVHVNVRQHDASGQIARQIVEHVTGWGVPWDRVCFDSSGSGAPVIDTVERLAGCPGRCVRINAGHAPSERRIGIAGQMAKERFRTRAAELLWSLAECIRRGLLRGVPPEVQEQLTTRGIVDKDGKLDLQAKLEWKKQHRGKSPDEADALAVVVERLLAAGVLSLRDRVEARRESFDHLPDFMRPSQPVNPRALRNLKVARTFGR